MTNITRRRLIGTAAAGAAMLAAPGLAFAADWPKRPVTIVLGFPPGGGLDGFVRVLEPYLAEKLGTRVLIENRTGASGNIATQNVIGAKPDGYTILFSTCSAMAGAEFSTPDLAFDPIEDLSHITLATQSSYVLIASKDLPANSWQEFVALAKAEPGKLVHACVGVGSVNHLLGELLSMRAGIELNTVQYKGGGPAITDLLANQAQVAFISVGQAQSYIANGQLKALLDCAPKRSAQLPDAPASAEFDLKDVDRMSFWIGVSAPKETPPEIVQRIQKAIAECYQTPELTDRMAGMGLTPVGSTTADYVAKLRADHELYGSIVTESGMKI